MKVYKILHKPTGLFYTPSRGSGNLSRTGKAYTRVPGRFDTWVGMVRLNRYLHKNYIDDSVVKYYDTNKVGIAIKKWLGDYPRNEYVKTNSEDWTVVEY